RRVVDVGLTFLSRPQARSRQFVADLAAQQQHQLARELALLINREPEPQPKLGVVFKQGVRPRRPATLGILRPRRRGQVAAINGRASGRIRDERTVSKKLREQFQIRRLAAARASSREVKQGFLYLLLPHRSRLDLPLI